jgi:S1-C subfamily serine protease
MLSAVKDFFSSITTMLVAGLSFLTGHVPVGLDTMPVEESRSQIVLSENMSASTTPPLESDVSTSTVESALKEDPSKSALENTNSNSKKKMAAEESVVAVPDNIDISTNLAKPNISDTSTQASLDSASQKARAALVNITCSSGHPNVGKMTGSGVIVDPKGIIVTNAHVAQYFLIEAQSNNTDCFIRTGSPAQPAYDAELIFISPQWLARHALTFNQAFKAINGDYDYAFLGITGSKSEKSLPNSFPYIPFSGIETHVGEQIVAAGYAAEILTESQIENFLYPTLTFGLVGTTSSFLGTHADIIELRGTAAAQGGSSGGGIVSADEKLLGMITLGSTQRAMEKRSFTAISTDYIQRMYEQESGKTVDTLFDTDPKSSIMAFRWRIPELARPLLVNISIPNFYRIIDCEVEECPEE